MTTSHRIRYALRAAARPAIANVLILVSFAGGWAPVRGQQITATGIASFGDLPIGVTSPRGDVHRLFILERSGRVRVIRDGALLPTPFLDISPEVTTAGEGGLLGLAFHPAYASNGRFFVSFTELNGLPQLREYQVSANPDVADPASSHDLLGSFFFPSTDNHCASDLHFGPDGMLYYSMGEGGISILAQDLGSYAGKLLRIDVDAPAPHVPFDNPYASPSDGALDLIWANGLRNPWRFSFDRRTGELYIADVGGFEREEIDFQPRSSGMPGSAGYYGGRNYGWPCMEGSDCHNPSCPCDPTGTTLTLPVFEWEHFASAAAIGGFVYRGSAIPDLVGRYICADLLQGKVWTFAMVNGAPTDKREHSEQLGTGSPGGPRRIVSFGEDANGELYFTCLPSGSSANVFRIDPAVPTCASPVSYCSTSTNSIGLGARMSWIGSASIASADLVLVADQAPPRALGAFRCGTRAIQQPFGNGWDCVGGSVVQLPFFHADAQGEARRLMDYASIPVVPGDVRNFQLIYRDPADGGARFNLSDGLRVVFCP